VSEIGAKREKRDEATSCSIARLPALEVDSNTCLKLSTININSYSEDTTNTSDSARFTTTGCDTWSLAVCLEIIFLQFFYILYTAYPD
jgi:hypothetical protein